MNLLTHISISEILYKNLKKRMYLDRAAFIYGNIKPDLTPKCLSKPHTLENYLNRVLDSADELMEGDVSLKEFSIRMGEICHYVSDFFCQYHLNEDIFHKFKSHFIYELKLHWLMLNTMSKISFHSNFRSVRKNIASIIKEMREEYSLEPLNMERDIYYALSTTMWICESVFYYSVHQFDTCLEDPVEACQIMTIAGGK